MWVRPLGRGDFLEVGYNLKFWSEALSRNILSTSMIPPGCGIESRKGICDKRRPVRGPARALHRRVEWQARMAVRLRKVQGASHAASRGLLRSHRRRKH